MNPIIRTNNPNNPENPASDVFDDEINAVDTSPERGPFQPFVPLKPRVDDLPAFPVDALPPRLSRYVKAVAEHTQTPVDMAAGVALGVLATCLQGKVRVEGNIDHYEQTSLYVFLVAPPGSRKSAVIHAMTTAIEDYEQDYNEKHAPQLRKNRLDREAYQRQINRLTKQLDSKYDSMTELELQHTQDNLNDLPDLHPLQLFTDDCTSEMMIKLLKDNKGRMALISAEGGAFDNITGRYTKKPNLDVWLKGICGDTIRVDRLNRDPDYIRKPALSMIISAQPNVLGDIMQNGMLDGRGFLARLFYVNVSSHASSQSFQSAPIPAEVKKDYHDLIFSLLDIPDDEMITLHLKPDAVDLMNDLVHDVDKFITKSHRDMREWGSKFIGLVLRIAGLLHVSAGLEGDISRDLIHCAIDIGRYAFLHAIYAYSVLGADETVEKAMHVVSKIRKESITAIGRSDLYQRCRGRFFRDVKDMEPVLELLERHGYIWVDVPPYLGVGRPSVGTVYVNPRVLEDE